MESAAETCPPSSGALASCSLIASSSSALRSSPSGRSAAPRSTGYLDRSRSVLTLKQRWVERYTPVNAGLAILNTTGLRHLVISPWAGLGVLALWAAGALILGGLMLRFR